MSLDDLPPQDLQGVMHAAIRDAGFAFTQALWGEESLTGAWPLLDPLLRRCLAQTWLHGQHAMTRNAGFEPDEVVEAFAASVPEHPLWGVFEELQLPDLLAWKPGAHEWCVTAQPIILDLDVELIYMVPPAEGDVVPEGSPFLPLVMRHDPAAGWLVLNFFNEAMPVPGWPPQM